MKPQALQDAIKKKSKRILDLHSKEWKDPYVKPKITKEQFLEDKQRKKGSPAVVAPAVVPAAASSVSGAGLDVSRLTRDLQEMMQKDRAAWREERDQLLGEMKGHRKLMTDQREEMQRLRDDIGSLRNIMKDMKVLMDQQKRQEHQNRSNENKTNHERELDVQHIQIQKQQEEHQKMIENEVKEIRVSLGGFKATLETVAQQQQSQSQQQIQQVDEEEEKEKALKRQRRRELKAQERRQKETEKALHQSSPALLSAGMDDLNFDENNSLDYVGGGGAGGGAGGGEGKVTRGSAQLQQQQLPSSSAGMPAKRKSGNAVGLSSGVSPAAVTTTNYNNSSSSGLDMKAMEDDKSVFTVASRSDPNKDGGGGDKAGSGTGGEGVGTGDRPGTPGGKKKPVKQRKIRVLNLEPHTADSLYEYQKKDKALLQFMQTQKGLFKPKYSDVKDIKGNKLVFFKKRIYIPAKLRDKTIQFYCQKYKPLNAYGALCEHCIWPEMEKDVEDYIQANDLAPTINITTSAGDDLS